MSSVTWVTLERDRTEMVARILFHFVLCRVVALGPGLRRARGLSAGFVPNTIPNLTDSSLPFPIHFGFGTHRA